MADEEPGTSDLILCKICNRNEFKYNCPRCNILFCSVDCYKSESHSNCSETFYRECVTEQLSFQSIDDTSKRKMMEILNRLNSEVDDVLGDDELTDETASVDSDDNPDTADLADRLRGVDLDDSESIWHALTDDEKKDFESLLQTGKVMEFVPSWKPWWVYNKESKLVQEVDGSKVELDDEMLKLCPEVISNVKDFNSISKKPADCVKYNLVNVLSAYLYTVRLFNGEHLSNALNAFSCFFSICNNLKSGANYEDAFTAVESVVQECRNSPSVIVDYSNVENLNFDIICLLRGPEKERKCFYVNSALSDLHRLTAGAKTQFKTQQSSDQNSKAEAFSKRFPDYSPSDSSEITAAKLRIYLKKIEYYLSYVGSYPSLVNMDLFGFDLNEIF